MRVTGTCVIAYEPAPNFPRLRIMGLHAQRAISHNQSTYWMNSQFYSHAYLGVVLDIYQRAVHLVRQSKPLPAHQATHDHRHHQLLGMT